MKYGYAYFVLFQKRAELELRLEVCIKNKTVNSIANITEDLKSLNLAMDLLREDDAELKDALALDKTE
jgi:hypothetical protein